MKTRSRLSLVTEDIKSFLVNKVAKDVSVTLASLKQKLLKDKIVDFSIATIDNIIQSFYKTFKLVNLISSSINTPKIMKQISIWKFGTWFRREQYYICG